MGEKRMTPSSVTLEEALHVWNQLHDMFQPNTNLKPGLIGDGEGNVVVTDMPGWNYIRYRDDLNRLSMVRNESESGLADGTPVMTGKRHHSDDYEQVLWVYWGPYSWDPTQSTIDQYQSSAHGPTHQGKSNDPAPIDYNNLSPGKVVATDPASLIVTVQDFIYANNLDVYEWMEADLDLTAHVPAIAGHRYVLVYMDLTSDDAAAYAGDIVAAVDAPAIPAPPADSLPLAIVELAFGDTAITNDYIWQYKLLYGSIGGDVPVHYHSGALDGGASLLGVQELMIDCWVDIQIQAGQIIPVQMYHRLIAPEGMYLGEGIVEIDLHTIVADATWGCGQLLIIFPPDSAMYTDYRVNLRHGIGNLRLCDDADVTLDSGDHIMLIYDGSYWRNFR